jgi:hypothetical protein
MIELMEIKGKDAVQQDWTLRKIYIRPEFVMSISEDNSLKQLHLRESLVQNLLPEQDFTKIILSDGRTIRVVGSMSHVLRQVGNSKRLLRD